MLSSDKTGGTGGGGTCPGSAGAFAFFIPNTVSLLSLVWSSPDAVGVGSNVIGGGGALGGKGGAIASVWGGGAFKAFDDVCLCNLDSISSKNDIPFWLLCLGGFIDGEIGEGLTLSSLDEPITSSCLSCVVYPVSPPTTNLSSLFFWISARNGKGPPGVTAEEELDEDILDCLLDAEGLFVVSVGGGGGADGTDVATEGGGGGGGGAKGIDDADKAEDVEKAPGGGGGGGGGAGIDDALLGGTDVVFGNGGAKVGGTGVAFTLLVDAELMAAGSGGGGGAGAEVAFLGAEVTFGNDGGGGAVGGNGGACDVGMGGADDGSGGCEGDLWFSV